MANPPVAGRPRYQVEALLGEGGSGEVFRAWDTLLRRHVALKRFSGGEYAASREAAWQEAIHLAAVQHPNVVSVFDCGTDEHGAFLVMELVAGETLEAVAARGAFPLRDFCTLVEHSLDGLAAAHEAGLLHRDLKPGNLMLKHGPAVGFQVKLVDFGIAGFTASFLGHVLPAASDQKGTILGTVEFMAPEQFEQQPVTVRSELYSMGCIFYFALTGNDPCPGDNLEAVVANHLEARILPLEGLRQDLPAGVCQWVMRLLSRRPGDRPASAAKALQEFTELFQGTPAL